MGLPTFSQDELDAAREALESVKGQWLERPEVLAVDIGYKIRESERNRIGPDLAVRAHVRHKFGLGHWRLPDPLSNGNTKAVTALPEQPSDSGLTGGRQEGPRYEHP